VFVTSSTGYAATDPDINTYNNEVNTAGSNLTYNGVPITGWQVIGSTTTPTSANTQSNELTSITTPIYLPDGTSVVSNGTNLWSGPLNHAINMTELDTTVGTEPVWTGTYGYGNKVHAAGTAGGGFGFAMGTQSIVTTGSTGATDANWIVNGDSRASTTTEALYAISPLITVVSAPAVPKPASIAVWSGLMVTGLA
jgi:hypothetical protein